MGNKPATGTPLTTTDLSSLVEDELDYRPHEEFKYEKNVCALSYWEPIRLLGEGSISDIHLVIRRKEPINVRYKEKRDIMSLVKSKKGDITNDNHIKEKDLRVLKSIMKDHVKNDRILEEMRREIYTMSRLDHAHICKLFEAYERRRHIYLVLEYCSGGDLTDYTRKTFTEGYTATVICKILSALAYMHKYGVVHRDIKLENICFAKNHETGKFEPKIIDFGLATKFLSKEYKNMTDKVGTLYSMAPQVLQGVYDSKCDLWSLGVVTYCLLSGYKPFWGPPRSMPWKERRKIMMDRIMRCEYMKMEGPTWGKISQLAKDFVASLLQLDPDNRPSAQEAIDRSPWIQHYHCSSCALEGTENETFEQAKHVHVRIRDQARGIIVSALSEQEIMAVQKAVENQDTLGSGRVAIQALRSILMEQQQPDTKLVQELDQLLRANKIQRGDDDSASETSIDYIDFFARALEEKGHMAMDAIVTACDELDVKGNRTVLMKDLKPIMDRYFPPGQLERNIVVDEEGNVSTIQVLEFVGRYIAKRTQNLIRSGDGLEDINDDDDDDDNGNLATASNTKIPGGKEFSPDSDPLPLYVYDESQKSLRKA